MKKMIFNTLTAKLILVAIAIVMMSCEKKTTVTPDENKKWVVAYKNIMLGDQNNTSIGQFFKTQTGEVFNINNAFSNQGFMSMVYFTEYGNNRLYLTFPGNAYNEAFSKEDETNNLFNRASVGLNYWEASNLNSGEIKWAQTMDKDMSKSEFDALVSSLNWTDFDSKFKEYNSGDADLSFTLNSMSPENGAIYMIQLNNTIRAFIYIKNLVTGGASGGSIKFDMVIEGGGTYNSDPSTQRVNPSKD